MERIDRKQSGSFSFSYIDIFFLLLAGLILSFGIGSLAEVHRESRVDHYHVYLSATVEEAFAHAIPEVGDTVFGPDGQSIGKVLSVETQEQDGKQHLKLKCRLKTETPLVGDEILLETPGSIRTMRIDGAEKATTQKKG